MQTIRARGRPRADQCGGARQEDGRGDQGAEGRATSRSIEDKKQQTITTFDYQNVDEAATLAEEHDGVGRDGGQGRLSPTW